MATLDQRLQDTDYKFWMKGGLCLAFVKQGLEKFADERSQKLHNYVKSALPNNCIAFHNLCGHVNKVSFDKTLKKWTLGCCSDCDAYTDVLVRLYSSHGSLKQNNWKNTNVQLWPYDHWNMAKIYMNEGQKPFQTSSKDTDLIGILNFLENCSIPKVDIQNAHLLSEVRKARNRIFHSATMKMTKADFDTSAKTMIDLLEDPFFLCRDKDAQDAVTAIKEVQQTDFEISKMHEFQVLTDKIEAMRNQHDVLHGEVDTIKSDINDEKNKLTTLLQNQDDIKISVNALQDKLRQKEGEIKELFIELASLKRIVSDDCQLSEKIDIRVNAVETSLGHTDIEIRDMKLTFKEVQHQIAEIKADIAVDKENVRTKDSRFKVQFLIERNEELQSQVQELKSKLQETNLTMKVKKSACEIHQRNIKDLQFQLQQLQKESKKKMSLQRETNIQPHNVTPSGAPIVDQEILALQDELKHQKERNKILDFEIDSLRDKLHDIGSHSIQQERENEIQTLKSRNCFLESKLESIQNNEKLIKKELSESLAKRDMEKEKIRAIEYQLDNFIASSKLADRERKEEDKRNKETITGLKIQIQFLEDGKEDAEVLLNTSKTENKDLISKLCQAMNGLSEKEKYIDQINTTHNAEISRYQCTLNEIKLQLSTTTEQRKSFEGQLRQGQSEIEKLGKDRKHDTRIFQNTLSTMKEKIVGLEKVCKQKDEMLNEARNAERLLKLQLENTVEDFKRQTVELQTMTENKEIITHDLDRCCTEVKTLSSVVESLTYKLKNEESKNESLRKQTALYESEIKQRKPDRDMTLSIGTVDDSKDENDEWYTPEEEVVNRSLGSAKPIPKVHFDETSFSDIQQTQKVEGTKSVEAVDNTDEKDASEMMAPLQRKPRSKIRATMNSESESEGFLNMRVSSRKQVDVMLDDDKACPWVSGCVILPDGNLVLCDFRNNKIKMLNHDFNNLTGLPLHAQPWDISVANSNEVVVTLLNSYQLQFVQVLPQLKKTRSIKLPMMCWGVEVVKDDIFITCLDNNGEGSVRVYDFDGIPKRKVLMHNGSEEFMPFEGPYNLTVSPASGNIFVSDYRRNVVTRMNSEGKGLYQYCDQLLNGPKGIVVDSKDNMLICSARAYNLQIIDADGEKHRTLSSSKEKLMKPWSVSYRHEDNMLVIGCQGKHLLVIELEHSRRRRESTQDRI